MNKDIVKGNKKEILLIDNQYKLVENGLDWQVYQFKKGGQEVRNVGTGETMLTVDRWVGLQAYFSKASHLHLAINYVARLAADEGIQGCESLETFLQRYKSISNHLEETVKNVLLP